MGLHRQTVKMVMFTLIRFVNSPKSVRKEDTQGRHTHKRHVLQEPILNRRRLNNLIQIYDDMNKIVSPKICLSSFTSKLNKVVRFLRALLVKSKRVHKTISPWGQ